MLPRTSTILLPLLAACTAPVAVTDLRMTVDPALGQVVHVTWTTDEPTRGHLEYGVDTDYGASTPIDDEATTAHAATMLGLLPLTDYHLRVASEREDGTVDAGDDATVATLALAPEIPDVDVLSPFTNANVGPYVLTSTNSFSRTHSTIVVLDTDGRVVWSWVPSSGVTAVHPLADGRGVYFVDGVAENGANTTLSIVNFDGHPRHIPCADCHHDALELGDGRYAVLRTRFETVGTEKVAGDQLIEITADGGVRVVWDAFEQLPVVENDNWDLTQFPDAADWTHANGLDYDPETGTYLVSLYGPEEIVAIDRATGSTLWILGGIDNQFTIPEGETFGPQHAPAFAPGGLRMFDNADLSGGSRLSEYLVDPVTRTATRTWSYQTPELAYTPVLGDVETFDDGSSLSAWGIDGRILIVGADDDAQGGLDIDADSIGQVHTLSALRP